jgi:hypothetical protein
VKPYSVVHHPANPPAPPNPTTGRAHRSLNPQRMQTETPHEIAKSVEKMPHLIIGSINQPCSLKEAFVALKIFSGSNKCNRTTIITG